MKDLKGKRRAGFYWLNDEPYVSVTNILKAIDKPALRFWFGKQVYLAVSKNPELGERDAMSAPYRASDKAKSRGQTIHSIVEAYKKEEILLDKVPEKFMGYVGAFNDWVKDSGVKVVEQERTVVSKKHRYAGTLDMLATFGSNKELWIVDVKTGKDIYPEVSLQLSAYQSALKEQGKDVGRLGCLLLKEDGKYRFEAIQPAFDTFLATKKLWEWMNRALLKEVGY